MEIVLIALMLFGGALGIVSKKTVFSETLKREAALSDGIRIEDRNSEVDQNQIFAKARTLIELPVCENDDCDELQLKESEKDFNFVPLPAKKSDADSPKISARSAIIMDMETDYVILEKNSHERMPIASISKIITALVAEEKLSSKHEIIISQRAIDTEGGTGKLNVNEKFFAKDLIDLMLISSSNDAATQIALEISGNIEDFAELMNQKIKSFGLLDSNFVEPSGLNAKNISTAFDIAQIADSTFEESKIWGILGKSEMDAESADGKTRRLKNTNQIISDSRIISGKTGFTNEAGGTLVVVAELGKEKRKMIFVILGSEDRFGEMVTLLNWIEENYEL